MPSMPVSGVAPHAVRAALVRVLDSDTFASSPRHRALLAYMVDAALTGRTTCLRETTLALEVLDRDAARFDPASDSIVRVEMARLRARLARYYDEEGRDDPVVVSVPTGSYVPQFAPRFADLVVEGSRDRARFGWSPQAANAAFMRPSTTAGTGGKAAMPLDAQAREMWISAQLLMGRYSAHAACEAEPILAELSRHEPAFAPAYSYRALALVRGAPARELSLRAVAPQVRELAEHALAMDQTQAYALVVLAAVATLVDYDLSRGEALYRQALRLAPDVADVRRGFAGGLLYMGRFDEALAEIRFARALDPLGVAARNFEAVILMYARRYDEAAARCRNTLATDAANPLVGITCALLYARAGMIDEARSALAGLPSEHADLSIAQLASAYVAARGGDVAAARRAYCNAGRPRPVAEAWAYDEASLLLAMGERERALARLDVAFVNAQAGLVAIDPAWDELRDDTAFRALVEGRAPQLLAVSDRSPRAPNVRLSTPGARSRASIGPA